MKIKDLTNQAVEEAKAVFKNSKFASWSRDFLAGRNVSIERCRKIRDTTVAAKKKAKSDRERAATQAANAAVLAVIILKNNDNRASEARQPANNSLAWSQKARGELAYGE